MLGLDPGKHFVSTSVCTLVLLSLKLMTKTVHNYSGQFLCNQKEMVSRFVVVDNFTLFPETMCSRDVSNVIEAWIVAENMLKQLVVPFHIGLSD